MVTSVPTSSQSRSLASEAARRSATTEKSTAVACHPRAASHRALRPSPAAISSALPGGRSWVSCSTQMFGAADQTSSLPAYRWFHAAFSVLSMGWFLWASRHECGSISGIGSSFVWEDVVDGSEGDHDQGEGGAGGVEPICSVDDQADTPIQAFVPGIVDA